MPLSDKAARCHVASVQGGHNGRPARSPRPRHRPFSNLRMLESSPVLSFLSEKEKKEPKKRNLNGVEFVRKPSGGPPRGVHFLFSGEGVLRSPSSHPHHPLPIFPCGAFLKEKPRKIIFADSDSAADGRTRRADPGGFMAFFSGSLFASGKKREHKKSPKRAAALVGRLLWQAWGAGQRALVRISSRSFSAKASSVIVPRSPSRRERTETRPSATSLSPSTSI